MRFERIGSYDVTALIGEGGMGQVYQATDTKLNRQVALKILPEAFATDPDRLARFQREAQVLASLNHPNIAQIHGLEESGGTRALVLELVEGPTLADRISKGPIPVDEALPVAKQIAEALEAAHEQGVIHRDLKPANVKVRDDGTVKVLDFGLAKALDTAPEGDPSQSPTLTAAATQMGVIMGTAAYMSPEQARGKPADKRADIWAFGCVLYEMVTGGRAFGGSGTSEVLAGVIKSEPNWSALPGDLSATLHTYLRRCLQKDPKQRVRDIGDLRLVMEGAFESVVIVPGSRVTLSKLPLWLQPVPVTLGAVTALVVAGLIVGPRNQEAVEPSTAQVRFEVSVPEGLSMTFMQESPLALSRDGTLVAYLTADGIAVRPVDSFETRVLPNTREAITLMFSPDGRRVAFFQESYLRWVTVDGGPVVTVAEVGSLGGVGSRWVSTQIRNVGFCAK